MKLGRRLVLKAGGVALTLPLLESLTATRAQAAQSEPPFAIFMRQACGVASQQTTNETGNEPERFWPRHLGPLTLDTVKERAVEELKSHLSKLLIIKNVNMSDFNYGDGHARGALQGLTAAGPMVAGVGDKSEAAGESIDNRIGRELNPNGRDSLFLYAGPQGGWLGGPCISYRGPGQRRAALRDPYSAYRTVSGAGRGLSDEEAKRMARRQSSINDLVRDQMKALMSMPDLSKSDRQRLDLHFTSIRDLEHSLACRVSADAQQRLETGSNVINSTNGEDLIKTVQLHMDVAVMAVACGYTRSVAIQVGNGNDGSTRYLDPETGHRMENYHYVSHRRVSHDASGDIIRGADLLHHKIDRYFAQMFRYLLDKLHSYPTLDGGSLLDAGVAVWYNDHGDGPAHGFTHCPFILAGSAGGFFKQGQHVQVKSSGPNHNRLLATIGSAVGLRKPNGDYFDEFGDRGLGKGILSELLNRG